MNGELVEHIKDILTLRDEFATISHIMPNSRSRNGLPSGESLRESMKIWARWIITHRSLCSQRSIYLPDDDVQDPQIIRELQDKGSSTLNARYTYKWLLDRCRRINNRYVLTGTYSTSCEGGYHGKISVEREVTKYNVLLSCRDSGALDSDAHNAHNAHDADADADADLEFDGLSLTQVIPLQVYNKMCRMVNTDACFPHMIDNFIWLCSTLYSLLDGKGLQWAVPPKVMKVFQRELGCYTELFASPLNTFNNSYYSLFPVDSIFSSKGNFFHAKNKDFQSGVFQVNPPFIDPLFTKTTERILELLEIADEAGKDLTFIYVMPEWKDFTTYAMVSEARFCVRQIHLLPGQHSYYQYSTDNYIKARFGTHIIFLSTDMNCCSNSLEYEIREAFQGRETYPYHGLVAGRRRYP